MNWDTNRGTTSGVPSALRRRCSVLPLLVDTIWLLLPTSMHTTGKPCSCTSSTLAATCGTVLLKMNAARPLTIAMAVTDTSYRTIVLNAEVQRAAFGIGQRDHIIHNLRIGLRPCDFAFEFHAQRFPIRYHHDPLHVRYQ